MTEMELREYWLKSSEAALANPMRPSAYSPDALMQRSGNHTLIANFWEPLRADFKASHQTDRRLLGWLTR
jgi:hypothetical protein